MAKHPKHESDWDKEEQDPVPKHDPLAKIADTDPHAVKMVKVKCITDQKPYIQDGRQLAKDEEAEVTEDLAALLRERGQVE